MADTDTEEASSGNHSVQLGMGTLIVIALIVTMCSGKGEVDQLKRETVEIKNQLREINGKLDMLVAKGAAVEAEGTPADAGAAPPRN